MSGSREGHPDLQQQRIDERRRQERAPAQGQQQSDEQRRQQLTASANSGYQASALRTPMKIFSNPPYPQRVLPPPRPDLRALPRHGPYQSSAEFENQYTQLMQQPDLDRQQQVMLTDRAQANIQPSPYTSAFDMSHMSTTLAQEQGSATTAYAGSESRPAPRPSAANPYTSAFDMSHMSTTLAQEQGSAFTAYAGSESRPAPRPSAANPSQAKAPGLRRIQPARGGVVWPQDHRNAEGFGETQVNILQVMNRRGARQNKILDRLGGKFSKQVVDTQCMFMRLDGRDRLEPQPRPWTDDDENQLKSLLKGGSRDADAIADSLARMTEDVAEHMEILGLRPTKEKDPMYTGFFHYDPKSGGSKQSGAKTKRKEEKKKAEEKPEDGKTKKKEDEMKQKAETKRKADNQRSNDGSSKRGRGDKGGK